MELLSTVVLFNSFGFGLLIDEIVGNRTTLLFEQDTNCVPTTDGCDFSGSGLLDYLFLLDDSRSFVTRLLSPRFEKYGMSVAKGRLVEACCKLYGSWEPQVHLLQSENELLEVVSREFMSSVSFVSVLISWNFSPVPRCTY